MRALIFLLAACFLQAADPPPDLAKRVAFREERTEAERANYTYTQSVVVQEYGDRGRAGGEYREVREVIFSPQGERTERPAGRPTDTLKRLRLTDEDMRDIREVQPLLLTVEQLPRYETAVKGEETVEGIACWVLQIRPRQILYGQRMFEGLLWVDQRDYSVVRLEGRAVPQIYSTHAGKENLFPYFTTVRERIGSHWFPLHTYSDDTLHFSSGPIRTRMTIRYRNYKRFQAESRLVPE